MLTFFAWSYLILAVALVYGGTSCWVLSRRLRESDRESRRLREEVEERLRKSAS